MTGRQVIAVLTIGVVAACGPDGPPDDQATGSIDSTSWVEARALPAVVQAQLDSGNAAFRAQDYERARRHYYAASEAGPDEPAVWFGVYMVERQLGNLEAAESAMRRTQEISPGASLIHPEESPAGDSLPPGHP